MLHQRNKIERAEETATIDRRKKPPQPLPQPLNFPVPRQRSGSTSVKKADFTQLSEPALAEVLLRRKKISEGSKS